MARKCRPATAVLTVAAVALSACGLSGGLSVGADPTGLIFSASFVEWEDLPLPAQGVRPPLVGDEGEYLGVAVVLPGSEPRRLFIAIWSNACMPVVTVSAPNLGSPPRLDVTIGYASRDCGEILKMWPFEVALRRDVDPASVVLQVADSRPW